MAHNEIKGQKYLEIFATNNQLLVNKWRIHASIKKIYDDESKTYVYCLKGKSPVPLMFWPKVKINAGDLTYPLIVFQIHFEVGANILIDIGLMTCNNLRKRITLSSKQKTARITVLSVILPLTLKKEATWSHVIVDVEDIVSSGWKEEKFQNIFSIHLGGMLHVKRIFTLRKDMIYTQAETCLIKYEELPKHMSLAKHVAQNYHFISCENNGSDIESKTSMDKSSMKSCSSLTNLSSNSVHSESSGYSNASAKDSMHSCFKLAPNARNALQTRLINKDFISNAGDVFHNGDLEGMIPNANSIGPLLSRLSLSRHGPLCSSNIKPMMYNSKRPGAQLLSQERDLSPSSQV